MICQICKIHNAVWDNYYGWLPCNDCQRRQSKLSRPTKQIEFTTESIKTQRRLYGQDMWGMHRKGQLSKEWVDKYGAKKALQRGFTKEEIKNAKNVWKGSETYYK